MFASRHILTYVYLFTDACQHRSLSTIENHKQNKISKTQTTGRAIIFMLLVSFLIVFLIGFGENTRVLDWIFRRCDGHEDIATPSPIGLLPKPNSLNLDGLGKVEMEELMSVPKDYWLKEIEAIRKYFNDQLSSDIPSKITSELNNLEARVKQS